MWTLSNDKLMTGDMFKFVAPGKKKLQEKIIFGRHSEGRKSRSFKLRGKNKVSG